MTGKIGSKQHQQISTAAKANPHLLETDHILSQLVAL